GGRETDDRIDRLPVHRRAARLALIDRGEASPAKLCRTGKRAGEREGMCKRRVAVRDGEGGESLEIRQHAVTPPHGLVLLDGEKIVNVVEARAVDLALKRVPGAPHRTDRVDPLAVVVEEILPQSATRFRALGPADVMEPEQKRV